MFDPAKPDMRGIVRPSVAGRHFKLQRWASVPPLNRFVDRFWKTEWSLSEPFVQSIVTYPAVNLVFQADGSAVVSGVRLGNDERALEGDGWAFGVLFRTGGFAPFTERPIASLVDCEVSACEIFGAAADPLAAAVLAAEGDEQRIEMVSEFLVGRAPSERTPGEGISDLVESAVRAKPPVTSVADLALLASVSPRTLQRQFKGNVGVGAKVVLDRHRIQAAGERARRPVQSWSDVAAQLGFADQAHLTSAVSSAFGQPPATYARQEQVQAKSQ